MVQGWKENDKWQRLQFKDEEEAKSFAAIKQVAMENKRWAHCRDRAHVALHRSMGDAALQAGNSETIIRRHYLNLHPKGEGGQFFLIVPDPERHRPVLAPKMVENPNPHLVAV